LAAETAHFKSQTSKPVLERKDSSRNCSRIAITDSEGINQMPMKMKSPQNYNPPGQNLKKEIITRSNSARQL